MGKVKFNKNLIIKNPNKFSKVFEEAEKLPPFDSQEEADKYFIQMKQDGLDTFKEFIELNDLFSFDYTPESLKKIELVYYDLYEGNKFGEDFIKIEDYELCMNLYFGEVMVRNTDKYQWTGKKHFLTENGYYLAIEKKLLSMAIKRLTNYYNTSNNKRKQSIYRKFKKYSK